MPIATEIVVLQLKEGLNLEEAGSPSALQWKKCASVLSSQPGFVRLYWGMQAEDPKTFVATIDWEVIEDHQNFVNSEAYTPFTADLTEIFDFVAAPPHMYHVNFTSDSVAAREAPVTEFAPFSLPANSTSEQISSLEDNALAVLKHANENGKCTSFATGWAFEELDNPNAPQGKTTLLQGMLGWHSIDDHMELRDTSEFKELITPVRSAVVPPVPGKGMFHVKLHGKPEA